MTTLTKRGEPRQGTRLDVQLTDDSWLTVTVVGKAYGRSGGLVRICIEAEGYRRDWVPWGGDDGIVWRPADRSTDAREEA